VLWRSEALGLGEQSGGIWEELTSDSRLIQTSLAVGDRKVRRSEMAPRCTICTHAERDAIDDALVSGTAYSAIARQFEVGPESVRRHHQNHVSPALAAIEAERKEAEAADLVARIERLIARAETMFSAAAKDGQSTQALNVLKEMRQLLELWGKATGQLDDRPQVTVNLMASPEWLAVRDVILSALYAYPDARAAGSGRLLELEAGS